MCPGGTGTPGDLGTTPTPPAFGQPLFLCRKRVWLKDSSCSRAACGALASGHCPLSAPGVRNLPGVRSCPGRGLVSDDSSCPSPHLLLPTSTGSSSSSLQIESDVNLGRKCVCAQPCCVLEEEGGMWEDQTVLQRFLRNSSVIYFKKKSNTEPAFYL